MTAKQIKSYTFWLFALSAVVIFAGIGLRDPWPPDEPRFALMAKEMWDTGHWFFPHRAGEIYPDKPPLVMWMMLMFYALLGNLKLAFLMPSALLSMATLWLTYDIGKRLWSPKIGLYAGCLLALSLHFILQAKSGQLDAPVAFWVMLGCYGLLRHLLLGPNWGWYYVAFFAMGMGIITKGVGFLPVLMLFGLIIVKPSWYDKNNQQWLKWLAAIGFLLLAVSLWLVPMLIQVANHPTAEILAYRDNILLKQTVDRYADSWAHHQPFYYYIVEVIPLFWLPLSLFIPSLIAPLKNAVKNREARIIYPLTMLLLGVFFFSLSAGKRAEYMLPLLPMLVLLLAPYVEDMLQHKILRRLLVALLLLFTLLLSLIGLAGIFELEKITRLTAKYAINPWYWMFALGAYGILMFVFFRQNIVKLYAGFMLGLWLSYGLWAAPLIDQVMSTQPMMQALARVIPKNAELAIVGMREKLFLHTFWPTSHFGYHQSKHNQQQAAINWLSQKPNRYVLVNSSYLNDCFKKENSLDYASFHQQKWLLFSTQQLDSSLCQSEQNSYSIYSAKDLDSTMR